MPWLCIEKSQNPRYSLAKFSDKTFGFSRDDSTANNLLAIHSVKMLIFIFPNWIRCETSSPKGNDRSPESNVPRSNVVFSAIKANHSKVNSPETLFLQPFPHPNDATHKIWSRLANWLQRYSSSKVWNFPHSGANNSKLIGLIWPKIELDRAFMPVPATSNFDDDSMKNERASMETAFSHYV